MLPPLDTHKFEDLGTPRTVAVVVPSFNHAKYVERTLRSIFAQTRLPQFLLVIDDGSHDDSPATIERVLKDAPCPAEFIARENRGLSATLNEGIDRVRPSRFFAYLGSDDIWLPNFLDQRTALLEQRPKATLAYGNAYSIDAHDRIIDCTVDWARYTDGDVREMLLDTIAPLSPTVLYRTAAIQDMRWNENSRLEDYEFYLRLSTTGEFAYDPEILSAWRQHGANASEGTQMMLEERISAICSTAALFGLSDPEIRARTSLVHFRAAQEFMRSGRKKEAVTHGLSNVLAAKSIGEILRFFAGLVAPKALIRRKQARQRAASSKRYDKPL